MIELEPAASLDSAALARLFTAAYEGYWFPIELDGPAFALMAATADADLDLSRIATDEGVPVGIALVARRGPEGWVGGMGVVPSHRRRGIGEATLVAALNVAHDAGVERITLEVLEQNLPARALYERLGFEHVRDLEVWSLPGRPDEKPFSGRVGLDDALLWIGARRRTAEPWQRGDGTIARLRQRDEPLDVVTIGDERDAIRAAAVVWRRRGNALIQQAASDDPAAEPALHTGIAAGAERVLWSNLPVGDPMRAAVAAMTDEPIARQLELWLQL